jgi:hypothetical protein
MESMDHSLALRVAVNDAGTISVIGGTVGNTATVTQADLAASNGVIHIIDSILEPPAPGTTPAAICATCSDLGWDANLCGERACPVGTGNPNVCGESDDGFTCQNAVSYERAVAACTEFGARLCTADELLGGEAEGTGCGHDGREKTSHLPYESLPCHLLILGHVSEKRFRNCRLCLELLHLRHRRQRCSRPELTTWPRQLPGRAERRCPWQPRPRWRWQSHHGGAHLPGRCSQREHLRRC